MSHQKRQQKSRKPFQVAALLDFSGCPGMYQWCERWKFQGTNATSWNFSVSVGGPIGKTIAEQRSDLLTCSGKNWKWDFCEKDTTEGPYNFGDTLRPQSYYSLDQWNDSYLDLYFSASVHTALTTVRQDNVVRASSLYQWITRYNVTYTFDQHPIPEPTSLYLMLIGLVGIVGYARRNKK